jgi:hypothetical protein
MFLKLYYKNYYYLFFIMKIFISYKQTWITDSELTDKLWKIRDILSNMWHQSFIYYFDSDFQEQSPKEIIEYAKEKIEESDIIISFINYEWKSEWMMEELWIAFWLDKKIMIFMNIKYEHEYYLSYWLSNNTVLFSDFSEIKNLLLHNLLLQKK